MLTTGGTSAWLNSTAPMVVRYEYGFMYTSHCSINHFTVVSVAKNRALKEVIHLLPNTLFVSLIYI